MTVKEANAPFQKGDHFSHARAARTSEEQEVEGKVQSDRRTAQREVQGRAGAAARNSAEACQEELRRGEEQESEQGEEHAEGDRSRERGEDIRSLDELLVGSQLHIGDLRGALLPGQHEKVPEGSEEDEQGAVHAPVESAAASDVRRRPLPAFRVHFPRGPEAGQHDGCRPAHPQAHRLRDGGKVRKGREDVRRHDEGNHLVQVARVPPADAQVPGQVRRLVVRCRYDRRVRGGIPVAPARPRGQGIHLVHGEDGGRTEGRGEAIAGGGEGGGDDVLEERPGCEE